MKTKAICYAPGITGHHRGTNRPLEAVDRIKLTKAQYESLHRKNCIGSLEFPTNAGMASKLCKEAAKNGLFPSFEIAETTLKQLMRLKLYRKEAREASKSASKYTNFDRAKLLQRVLHANSEELAKMLEALK